MQTRSLANNLFDRHRINCCCLFPPQSWEQVRVSPTRLDVQLRALEHTNTAVSSRLSTIEETVRTQEKLIQELFSQLREYRDENNTLKVRKVLITGER